MQLCLSAQNEQALRLLNSTGVANIREPLVLNGMDGGPYRELLDNASKLYNETLITCDKKQFLTVKPLAM